MVRSEGAASLAPRPSAARPVGRGGDGGEWGGGSERIRRGIHRGSSGRRRWRGERGAGEGGFATSAAARGGRGFRFPAGQEGGP